MLFHFLAFPFLFFIFFLCCFSSWVAFHSPFSFLIMFSFEWIMLFFIRCTASSVYTRRCIILT
ncbi:hypothetical protein B0T22DRAFT_113409 [Podospora appendiculata]|uniref:Uncharacterized protein n=1 Tax=Podospora appendiculata TaxID=314037 RepID=A0AAE0XLU8_9PEZI|nr:hypothetical protein B0T22DRAFT_113409 [Podospora appendiculata]